MSGYYHAGTEWRARHRSQHAPLWIEHNATHMSSLARPSEPIVGVGDRLQAGSRLLIRSSIAVFTAIILLLLQSAFWSDRVSAWMQAIIFATALLSYFRPQYGLLAVAALTPLGQVGSRTLDSHMRGAEALVLAFLAGVLVRGWTLREFRTFPSTRLEIAALVFGFVVATSCIEQIWFTQIQMDFAWPFGQGMLSHASRTYITSSRGFGWFFRAMLLLEGLALLLIAARYVSTSAVFTRRLVVMLVVGAIATAILAVTTAADAFAQTRAEGTSIADFFAQGRWVGHISDVNAAGSYFAMIAFIAIGLGVTDRTWRLVWMTAGAVLFIAMLMAGSRTAVAATGVVGAFVLVRVAISRASYRVRVVSAGAAALAVGAAAFLLLRTTGGTPSEAINIRWLFLQTTARMLSAEPAFGVGVGQFSLWAAQFAPPALFQVWKPDNAHNNLAQIAGELGFVGLIAFLMVLAATFRPRSSTPGGNPLRHPLIAGLIAFVLTWLGGHPLLVAEVAYPFWITLGVAAALFASDAKAPSAAIVGIAAALLVISIPFRVTGKSAQLDLTRVTYGLSAKRQMTSRARFFVPESGTRVEIPLRARSANDIEPIEVDVSVDGLTPQTITLTDRSWRRTAIDLPSDPSRRFHQIDLRIRPGTLDTIDPDRSSVEVGKWEIISKPHG